MPSISSQLIGTTGFNTLQEAAVDVTLVKGAFYVVDDIAQRDAIPIKRISLNQIVWVQSEEKNYQVTEIAPPNYGFNEDFTVELPVEEHTFEDTPVWTEFTGFGSTQPGGTTDPLSVGTLTVNPGSVGTTLTLETGSALTITGQDGGDILLINSGGVTPITVNNQGIIVLDDYDYTPTVQAGGIFYSASGEFYLGIPDPPNEFVGGFNSDDSNNFITDISVGENRNFSLTTHGTLPELGFEFVTDTIFNLPINLNTLLKFTINSNDNPTIVSANVYLSTSDTWVGPEGAAVKFSFPIVSGENEMVFDTTSNNLFYLFFIFNRPNITYEISNFNITRF